MGHTDLADRQAVRAVLPVARRVALLCLGLAPACPASAAGACDAALLQTTPRTSATYYADRGSYCEGTIAVQDAGSVDLVGLQIGSIALDNARRFTLRLPPLPVTATPIKVTAIEVGGKLNYRLDAELGAAGLSVDATVVIDKIALPLAQIAFLASAESGATVLNFPVELAAAGSGQVDAIYVASMPVRRLRVSVAELESLKPAQDDVVLDDVRPRTPIHVALLRKPTGRWVMVSALAFSYLGDDGLRGRSYRVYVPAAP